MAQFSFGFINWVDNVNWPPQRGSGADVSSASPSSERIEELWAVCGLYTEIWSYTVRYWLMPGNVKNNRIN